MHGLADGREVDVGFLLLTDKLLDGLLEAQGALPVSGSERARVANPDGGGELAAAG